MNSLKGAMASPKVARSTTGRSDDITERGSMYPLEVARAV
jgi:hypothetical protein